MTSEKRCFIIVPRYMSIVPQVSTNWPRTPEPATKDGRFRGACSDGYFPVTASPEGPTGGFERVLCACSDISGRFATYNR